MTPRSLRWLLACSSITLPIASIAACNSIAGLDSFDKVPYPANAADATSEPDVMEAAPDTGSADREEDAKDAALDKDVNLIEASPNDGGAASRKWAMWPMNDYLPVAPTNDASVPFPSDFIPLDAGASYPDAALDADAHAGIDLVLDNRTGMQWERNPTGDLKKTQSSAQDYCDKLEPGGGWTLPTRIELVSLLKIGAPPEIDTTVFSGIFDDVPYWTASSVHGSDQTYWLVRFDTGEVVFHATESYYHVRCVKPVTDNKLHYTPFGPADATIIDMHTNLQWQRMVPAVEKSHDDAANVCSTLSIDAGDGWRLPTLKELQTLVDDQPHEEYEDGKLVLKAIDREAFPGTPAGPFWSQSAIVDDEAGTKGFVVDFATGSASQVSVGATDPWAYVRCVTFAGLTEPAP